MKIGQSHGADDRHEETSPIVLRASTFKRSSAIESRAFDLNALIQKPGFIDLRGLSAVQETELKHKG
jgi:hypothetical protein